MKIQKHLSLITSLIFGIIFVVISVLVYGLFRNTAERVIYKDLEKMAYITAFFYLEEDEMSNEEFATIRRQFSELTNTNYQIYDMDNQISWGVETSKIDDLRLQEIREKQALSFKSDDFFSHGIFYHDNQGDFVIIAKEKRDVLSTQLNALFWILVFTFVLGILSVFFLSRWIAKVAYYPFVIQKNFVKYVSHEFKTPLATILGHLEVFLIKGRSPEEYQKMTEKLVQEVHQLEKILDTLLVVSDLRKSSEVASDVRLDELIWKIIDQIKNNYSNSKVLVNINIEPDEFHLLNVHKDETQLLMALFNLIENAVKYSQDLSVEIEIFMLSNRSLTAFGMTERTLCLAIKDNGIGIPADQIKHVSKPFYRADNTNQIQGSGIGLSIALRILEKNNIDFEIFSKEQKGTTVLLKF
ncbi:MAG: HAMP domain-containing histidine kinase [Bacteroidales bacterium]|jgi:K+-sensing histidine kinase KdpD|nr:HAMP domain-containing histidine kinase [Bacteroidales bacterium]